MEALHHPPHPAGRLPAAVDDDGVLPLPELVLVEATPDGVLLDEQHVLRLVASELDDVLLDDGGHAPAARAHAPQVDGVARVADGDGADHGALARGEEVQLLAQRVERHLEVLDDGIRLVLLLEGVLLGVADGVLGDVVEVADAGGLAATR